jgi:hypothetical protein
VDDGIFRHSHVVGLRHAWLFFNTVGGEMNIAAIRFIEYLGEIGTIYSKQLQAVSQGLRWG